MSHLQGLDAAEKRQRVLDLSHREGLKAAAVCGSLSSAGVYYFTKFSPWFNKSTNVSAKVALAVSPFFLAYHLRGEMVMVGANKDPRSYGIISANNGGASDVLSKATQGETHAGSGLYAYQQAANWLYQHPFRMIVGMGVPTVGAILYSTRHESHLKLSQKLMHTRVLGQMSVLTMLVVVMGFREYMSRHGGLYIDEFAEEAQEEEQSTVALALHHQHHPKV